MPHLSDTDLQQYVLDKTVCPPSVIQHMEVCESCRTAAAGYQWLVGEISRQPAPAFDFDLSGAVLSRLQEQVLLLPEQGEEATSPLSRRRRSIWPVLLPVGLVVIAGCAVGFRGYLAQVFFGIFPLFIYLIFVTAIPFLLLLGVDLYKRYKRQLKILDFN